MYTNRYKLHYVTPEQDNQEHIINDAIKTFDSFCDNVVIESFINQQDIIDKERKYIVKSGDKKDCIAYFAAGWEYLKPFRNMMAFVRSTGSFFIFDGSEWGVLDQSLIGKSQENLQQIDQVSVQHNKIDFLPSAKDMALPSDSDYHCIYLNSNTKVDISQLKFNRNVLLIKQNCNNLFDVQFVGASVLYVAGTKYKVSQKNNSMDMLEFFKMPQSNEHIICNVINQCFVY